MMIEQYKHVAVPVLESSKRALEVVDDTNSLLQSRIRELELIVERQGRSIRDLQGLVEHLNYKLAQK